MLKHQFSRVFDAGVFPLVRDVKTCLQCGRPCESGNELCTDCSTNLTIDTSRNPQSLGDAPTIDGPLDGLTPLDGQRPERVRNMDARDVVGQDFGDYELLEELARGGMGVVYRARHKKLNRISALKMVLGGRFSSSDDIQRFHVEAAAAAQLDHSGIVPIYEIGEHDGLPFFAMKFVEGGSLAEHRERIRKDPRKVADFVSKVARAVHHAHQRGILHRDIKPANILLDENDNPLLTDLGLAKSTTEGSAITQTGAVVGTPSYMSPEQAQSGQAVTTAADVYSIGAILYELLAGRPPHQGRSAVETVMQVMQEAIEPPRSINGNIDRDLELICLKCLERLPENRYESANDLGHDLERWLHGEPISVRPPSVQAKVLQWVRRNQGLMYAIFAMLAGLGFSFPILLSLLGTLDNPAGLYLDTSDDPLPLIYSFTNIPVWVSIASSLFITVLWPTLGLQVALVTRPANWKVAVTNGSIVACSCVLLFVMLLGWVPFMIASQVESNDTVRTLATAVWPYDNGDRETIEQVLEKKYPKLIGMEDNLKVNYIGDRIFADGITFGPRIWLMILYVAFSLGVPIVIGTVTAHALMRRGHWWWVFCLRYFVGWGALTLWLLMISAAVGGGRFNGRPFSELQWWSQLLFLGVSPLIAFLVLRRWRR